MVSWDSSSKRLEIGGRSITQGELLLGGALGLIIVAALVLTIVSIFRGNDPEGETPTVAKYECTKCGKITTIDLEEARKDPSKYPPEMMGGPGPMMGAQDCDVCKPQGFEKTVFKQRQCPKCKEWILPPAGFRDEEMQMSGPAADRPADYNCPKCQVEVIKFEQDEVRKKLKG